MMLTRPRGALLTFARGAFHAQGIRVSVVNLGRTSRFDPARIKTYGESELARNKTDKLDAGLTAHFCRAHVPPAWIPPLPHLRELRELVRQGWCGCASGLHPR